MAGINPDHITTAVTAEMNRRHMRIAVLEDEIRQYRDIRAIDAAQEIVNKKKQREDLKTVKRLRQLLWIETGKNMLEWTPQTPYWTTVTWIHESITKSNDLQRDCEALHFYHSVQNSVLAARLQTTDTEIEDRQREINRLHEDPQDMSDILPCVAPHKPRGFNWN